MVAPLELKAMALHRAWARHTIRHAVRVGKHARAETDDEAHARRWDTMAQRVRDEFLAEASR
jgi:hypothetical protein